MCKYNTVKQIDGLLAATLLREALGLTATRVGGRRISDQLLRWIDL
jgi:hypothetical protein